MNQASEDYKREHGSRSLDTIRVHNPTSEDYIFWNDRYGSQPEKTIVPKAQRDIGFGKGNNDIPRYKAERYTEAMIVSKINDLSDKQWAERKKELRMLTHDEILQIGNRENIRTNDRNLWEEWFPKIWLGVIEKFGGTAIPDPVDPMIPSSSNPMVDTMNKLEIADKMYEPETKTD